MILEVFLPVLVAITACVTYIFRKKIHEYFNVSVSESDKDEERSGLLSDPSIAVTFGVTHRTRRFREVKWTNKLNFAVNGKNVEIINPNPEELLASFLREKLLLKGTKLGCEEGGCGACSVVIQTSDQRIISANSCLRLLCANDGLSITTVEGIGSTTTSLSVEQKRLVGNNGTQCGYCTPGWITSMHALVKNSEVTGEVLRPQDIDKHFDGNICRCTGYRPILQAFHSLCYDNHGTGHNCSGATNKEVCRPMKDVEDIEGDCHSYNLAKKSAAKIALRPKPAAGRLLNSTPLPLYFYNPISNKKYFRPVNFTQLLAVIGEFPDEVQNGEVKFLAGNTSIGVTKYLNNTAPFYYADESKILIDVNSVPELAINDFNSQTSQLTVGAAVKISDLIVRLQTLSTQIHGIPNIDAVNHNSVFSVTAHHLYRIANTQVRNAGSWAGNLMIFLKYKSFPSDALVAFTTASVVLRIADVNNNRFDLPIADFLTFSFEEFCARGLFILSLTIQESVPAGSSSVTTISQIEKVAVRERNAHAYVNGGFNFQVNSSIVPPVAYNSRIVYGGVGTQIFIAKRAQSALNGQAFTASTLGNVLNALSADLSEAGVNTSRNVDPNFLISTAQNYLYLAFLRAYPIQSLPKNVSSAVLPWAKPISRGVEVFPINPDGSASSPIGKPVTKLEAPIQATGQATYPSDEVLPPNGAHGAIVFATVCAKKLAAIDTSGALQVPGVQAIFTAADIPGVNDLGNSLEVLVSVGSIVPFVGSPLAIIIADTEKIAQQAVQYVKVTYEDTQSVPVANIDEAIATNSFFSNLPPFIVKIQAGSPTQAIKSSPYRATGKVSAGGQYHFYMEAQSAFASVQNGEDLTVVCGTQDPAYYASQIASILGLTSNQVTVQCERTGGAFGGKIRSGMSVASCTALAARKLGRPVRIFNNRTWDMNMHGGREDWIADYEVGYDENGIIQAVIYKFYVDAGSASSDSIGSAYMGMVWADNAYFLENYVATLKLCKTNTPARTSMRAPGVVQTCFSTESIIEHVATNLGLPLNVVQERNFLSDGKTAINGQVITNCTLQDVWSKVMTRSQYSVRLQQVQRFNSQNLWRKRGIACSPAKYGMGWAGYNAGVRLGVRQGDGYVVVTHSGSEVGQGINTKVAQAVAMALGIDISLIKIEKTSTHSVVNGGVTGGSGTSEVMVQAALNACATLNARLDPYRPTASTSRKLNQNKPRRSGRYADPMPTSDWVSLVSSLPSDVSLNVEGWYSPTGNPNGQDFQYYVYCACVSEVELNVLSGEVHILSSELVYDCGSSLNPAIDIGQIEGALIMGYGWFFQERVEYESGSGVLKSVGTWEYKPPLAHDIPSVLNVTLIQNAFNTEGILGSKATAEPPMITCNSAYFATKMAIGSSRSDAGVTTNYFELKVPSTVDIRQQASLVSPQRFVLPY